MPVRYIKSIVRKKGVARKNKQTIEYVVMGKENNSKTFPDGIVKPVLSDCCAANSDCKAAFELLNDPLVAEEDKSNYNSWVAKNAGAVLNCNLQKK